MAEIVNGLYKADLGGGVLKKRVPRSGQGKSGGFRTLIATNQQNRCFFMFGFSKNERSNIDQDEEKALKMLASKLLSLSDDDLALSESLGELMEIICNAEN